MRERITKVQVWQCLMSSMVPTWTRPRSSWGAASTRPHCSANPWDSANCASGRDRSLTKNWVCKSGGAHWRIFDNLDIPGIPGGEYPNREIWIWLIQCILTLCFDIWIWQKNNFFQTYQVNKKKLYDWGHITKNNESMGFINQIQTSRSAIRAFATSNSPAIPGI